MNKHKELLYPKSLQEVWQWKAENSRTLKNSKVAEDLIKVNEISLNLQLKTYSR